VTEILERTPWRSGDNEMSYSFDRLTNGSLFTRASLFDISPSRTRLSTIEACAPLGQRLKQAETAKRKATGKKDAQLTFEEYFECILPKCFPVALYAIDVSRTEHVLSHWWLPQVEETEIRPMQEAFILQKETQNPAFATPSTIIRQRVRSQTSAVFTSEEATRSYASSKLLQDQLPGVEERNKEDNSDDQEARKSMRLSARLGNVMCDPMFTPATIFGGPWCFEGQVDQLRQAREKTIAMVNKRREAVDAKAEELAYLATCKAIESLGLKDPNCPIENLEVADKILEIYERKRGDLTQHRRTTPVNFLMQNMLIAIQQTLDTVHNVTTPRPFLCVSKKAGLLEYLHKHHPVYYLTFNPAKPKSQQAALSAQEREVLRKSAPVKILDWILDFWEKSPPGNVAVAQVRSLREFCYSTTQGKSQGPIDIADSILGAIAVHVLYSRGKPHNTTEREILLKAKQAFELGVATVSAEKGALAGPTTSTPSKPVSSLPPPPAKKPKKMSQPSNVAKPATSATSSINKAIGATPAGSKSAPARAKMSLTEKLASAGAVKKPAGAVGTGLFTDAQKKLQKDRVQAPLEMFSGSKSVTLGATGTKPSSTPPKPASLPSKTTSVTPVNVHMAKAIRDLPRAKALAQLAASRSREPKKVMKAMQMDSEDEEEDYEEMQREQELINDLVSGRNDDDDDSWLDDDLSDYERNRSKRSRQEEPEDDDDDGLRSVDGRKRRKVTDGLGEDDMDEFAHKHSKRRDSLGGGGSYGVVRGASKGRASSSWLATDDMNDDGEM